MRAVTFSFSLMLASAIGNPAGALPKTADCPLVHPEASFLKLFAYNLDPDTKGSPQSPYGDEAIDMFDGTTRIVSHYASFEILRNAVLICSYSEIVNRRHVNSGTSAEIRIPMPGILMRCEGIARYSTTPESSERMRLGCVHDPDE